MALWCFRIDLPFANIAALKKMTAASADVTIASDCQQKGTNLLVLKGQATLHFRFSFGRDSFSRHCGAACTAGYSLTVIEEPTLQFDLDAPDDYHRVKRSAVFAELVR
jgi:2-phospho-L-lactate guanylyltransferase (CobY/MobA/RfbA family)